jgi:tetratricopeptide (TPR) repeat protein
MNRYAAAEELYREALALATSAHGAGSPVTASVQSNLAELLTRSGRHAEAGELYRSAVQVTESHPEDARTLGISLSNLGGWTHATGRSSDAEPLVRRALEMHVAALGSDSEEAAVDRLNLARVLTELSRLEEAEACCRQALATFLRRHGPAFPETARCQASLALVLHRSGRVADAQSLYLEALATYEKANNLNEAELVALRSNLAWLLMQTSRWHSPGAGQP